MSFGNTVYRRIFLTALCGVLGACDATNATRADVDLRTPPPPWRNASPPSGSVLSQASLPAGDGGGSVSTNVQLPAQGEGVAVIRVKGSILVEKNPEATQCSAPLTGTWGPAGAYNQYFRVYFDVVLPNGQTIVQTGSAVAGSTTETVITSSGFPGGQIVRVWRSGVNSVCWITGRTDPVSLYEVSGGPQVLTVETLGPATVSADKQYLPSTSDTVTFTAGGNGGNITAAYWRFVAGDTLAVPGASSGAWINPWCEGQITCKWVPPVSGRMYVTSATIDGHSWTGVSVASHVVWVGKTPKLVLSCPESVPRGSMMNCTLATHTSGGTIRDVAWAFTDGYGTESHPPSGTTTSWGGPMVLSGAMRVSASVGGIPQDTTATITVTERGWTWAGKGISVFRDGTGTPCYDGTPVPEQPNGWNQGMNVSNPCAGDEMIIQPDSRGPADVNGPTDGFTVAPVTSGPNKGLLYVDNVALYLRRKSAYNPGIFSNAPQVTLSGWNLNHCPEHPTSANFYEFNRCKGVDVDGYIAGLRGHEGEGWNGGKGHFSAAVELVRRPENDPMLFLDEWVSLQGESKDDFVARLRREFYRRMQPVEDGARANGGLVTGNWQGNVFRWQSSTSTFELYYHDI